jgi:hypothetical protein
MKSLHGKWLVGSCILVVVVSVTVAVRRHYVVLAAQSPSLPGLSIVSTPPLELNPSGGGPAKATLQQAAEFAWEEFFALSWPAVQQTGRPNQRDTASQACALGDQSASCAGPLVWQTYRGKVEIFPGDGNPPAGYSATDPSFGYDALPAYNYSPGVRACLGAPSSQTPWVNLDETDQITLDSMYAGVVSAKASASNGAPQLIRFLAKANRVEYAYIASHKWWDGSAPTGATAKYVKANKEDPADPNNYVLLPDNSIEVKAGWRVLNAAEINGGRFHTATTRYYENSGNGTACYQQGTFGLVSLHIIQKTSLAPYFIYATFEQTDNILDANGRDVEDADGSVALPLTACRSDQQPPCPTTPSVTLNDTSTVNKNSVPPQVVLVPPTAQYCTADTKVTPPNRLFYLNTKDRAGLPTDGYICINKRDNDIPPVIVDTNKRAHALIQSYSSQKGIMNSVWQYYKLVNIQYVPLDKEHADLYGTQPGENSPLDAHNPNSYYLANIVVETNRSLQLFSGGLVSSGATGSNSDYDSQFPPSSMGSAIHHNMFYQRSGYNMGGCMGCHGSQGQAQGGDFSVIVAKGPVGKPEYPAPPTATGAALVFRNRRLK